MGEPAERHVDANGARLAVRDFGGTGRPVVLVHGGGPGTNVASFGERFPTQLAERFRVVAYDQRGHGRSSDASDYSWTAFADDVEAVRAAVGLERPLVVGHALGGLVALLHASRHRTSAGVVCVDGFASDVRPRLMARDIFAGLRALPALWRLRRFRGTPADLERLRGPFGSEAALRRDMVAGQDGRLRYRHTRANAARLNRALMRDRPSVGVYDRLRCPVLLVVATGSGRGRPGWPFTFEVAQTLAARHRHVDVETIDCGHDAANERPDELAELVAEHAWALG